MKKYIFLLFITVFVFQGCATTGKLLRYDGVYKRVESKGSIDYYQIVDESHFKAIYNHQGTEEQALEKLKNAKKILYTNRPEGLRFSSRSGSLVGSGEIKRNPDGSLLNSFFLVVKNGKITKRIDYRDTMATNIYTIKGKKIFQKNYDGIIPLNNNVFITEYLGLYGIRNFEGKEIIKESCDFIGKLNEGYGRISLNGKWGYINKDGKIIIKTSYDYANDFKDGVAPVKVGNRWFLINQKGKKVSKNGFYKVGKYFSKKFVPVKTGERQPWSYLNTENNSIHKIKTPLYTMYEKIGMIVLSDYKNKILVDLDGKLVLPYFFPYVWPVNNDRFIVKAGKKYGVVDKKMKKIIPFIYSKISYLTEYDSKKPFFTVKQFNDEGLFDYNGKIVLPTGSGSISQLSKKIFKRWYFDGTKTKLYKVGLEKPIFRAGSIERVFPDYFTFKNQEKWGVVDTSGKIIIEAKYDKIERGAEKQFIVKDGEKYGVLDVNNKVVFDINYGFLNFKKDCYHLSKGNTSYLYKNKLKEFKDLGVVEIFDGNYMKIVKKADGWKFGVIDVNSNIIVPASYDDITFDKKSKTFITRKKRVKTAN
ncbi:MAG: WG repeat-containing protein [Desulfobacterales bacterium]|nr:WG repeat-containing protein [Desulfobacterales bacterium]MCP4159356.1 WG repeat-containing protein [Deltaproteobacteria bacterium]